MTEAQTQSVIDDWRARYITGTLPHWQVARLKLIPGVLDGLIRGQHKAQMTCAQALEAVGARHIIPMTRLKPHQKASSVVVCLRDTGYGETLTTITTDSDLSTVRSQSPVGSYYEVTPAQAKRLDQLTSGELAALP